MKNIDVKVDLDDKEAKKKLQELTNKQHTANVNVNVNGQNSIKNTADEIDRLNKTVKNTGSVFGNIRNKLSDVFSAQRLGMGAFLTSVKAIHDATKNLVVTTNELDKSITDLSVAMNDTRSSATQYLVGLNKQAQELGVTTKTVADASDRWLRQNKNMKETTELVKDSVMLSTLGQIDSARATEYLTSAMNGYQKSVGEAVDIVSKLVEVDAKAAVDAGGLAEAMSRTANVANTAGVSMDKLLSYLATVGEVTQRSMSSVGEAFKTIFTRMSDIKSNKLALIDEDGTEEILSDVELTLKNVGIDLRKTVTEYNNYSDVLDNLASKWNSLTQLQQNALSKAFAGTRQAEMFRALMENYGKSLEYVEVSLNSAGAAQEKFNRAYAESLEAKKNTLQAAFESLTINSDFDKVYGSIIEATTALVQFIDKTNALKGIAAGAISGLLLKGFLGLKTGIYESYIQLNQFNQALQISKQTQISTDSFERLNLLCRNLSDSQLKLVLSSKALTTEQRVQLLVTSGLSKEEAILRLQSLNLLQSETGLAAGTMTLKNAMSGLWNTLLANPIGLIVAGITLAVSAFSSYNQKLEETKRKMIEASDAAKDEAKNITDLYNAYGTASEAYHSNKGSKEELESATNALLEALGLEKSEIQNLVEEYGNLDNAIDSVTEKALEEKLSKMTAGLNEVKENLIDAVKDAKGDIGSFLNGEETDLNFGDVSGSSKYISAIKKAGIEGFEKSVYSHAMPGSPSQKIDTNYLVPLGDDFDTYEGIIEVYENLQKIKKALEDEIGKSYSREELTESDIYNDVTNRINAFEEEYKKVLEYNKEINQLVARQEYNKYVKKNGVPETREEFEALEKTLSDNADANGRFVGSQDEVKSAISDTLAEIPALAQFFDKLADSINKATDASEKNANSSTPQKFTKANWESFVASDSEFQKQDENLIKLAEQGKLTIKVFEDTPNKQNILDHFGVSAEEAVQKLNSFIDRADQLSALGTNIRSLSDNLGSKKENPNKGITSDVLAGMPEALKECTKEWNKYENVMMDANSTYADCEKATNALATALLNNGNYLAGLTDKTEDAYISDLKAMGVMNAEQVVADALANKINLLAAEKEWNKLKTEEMERAMNGEINKLAEEKGWTEEVKNAMYRLTLQKMTFNKTPLQIADDIDNLIDMAEKAGVTAKYLAKLSAVKIISTSATNTGGMPMADALKNATYQYKKFMNAINDGSAFDDGGNKPNVGIRVSSTNSKSPSKKEKSTKEKSTKDKAKETKTTIDWIARSLKVLQDKIDLTKAKFDNLFGYNRKKNNLLKQIKEQKTLIEQTTRAVKAYQKETDKAFKNLGKKVKITTTVSSKSSSKSGSANDLASIAEKELGNYGGTKYKKYTGAFAAWCQSFVSYVTNKAGLTSKQAPKATSTMAAKDWFVNQNNFKSKNSGYIPQKNDLVYWWRGSKKSGLGHVGIVTGYKNGKFTTIEGNHGNKVARVTHSMNENRLLGFAKTSQYFDSSGTTTTTKTKTVKFTQDQINYIKQLVTNYNTSDKALMKSMVIKKYGEKQGELINAYIDSFDKLSDVKKSLETEIKTLHDLYGELRDLKLEYNEKRRNKYEAQYENKTTVSSKNKLIDKEIDLYKSDNKVQDNYLTRLKKDRTAQAKVAKASVKKIKTTKKNTSKGITKALKNKINALIKQRKKIPSSILKKVKKASQTAYEDLVDYNNKVDEVIEAKIDVDTAKEQNKTNIRDKKIEKQQNIQDKADSNISKLEAQAEMARDKKGNATAKEKNKYLKEQVKWIKQSYNAQINQAKIEGNTALVEELRAKKQKELLDNQIRRKQNLADEAEATINLYEAQAENVYTAKEKIALYKKEQPELKKQYDKLIEIAEAEGNATEAERLRAEYTAKNAENLKKQFDTIKEEVETVNGLLNNGKDYIQSFIDYYEAKGLAIDSKWFDQQMAYNDGEIANLKAALPDMEKQMKDMEVGSPQWYAAMNDYVTAATKVNNLEKENWEIQQKKNELELKLYEKMASKMEFINDEYEFMLDMIQTGNDLFDADSGSITDVGLATFSIKFDQMDLATEQIKNYKEELAKVKEQYEKGLLSIDDYEEKMENLTKKIWDATKAYKGLEEVIIQMVKDGLDAQLSALDKMIEKYKKALSSEKDLYEYQRNIAKQTKNIANIQKQIDTLSGDSSDEARSKIQKLKIQLEDAQDELRDTEYNKWYEDQTNMLDDMREEISDAFDDIIKNHREEILNNLVPAIRNASSKEKLEQFLGSYTMTETMQNIQNSHDMLRNAITDGQNRTIQETNVISGITLGIRTDIEEFLHKFPTLEQLKDTLKPLFDSIVTGLSLYGSGKENETNPNVIQADPVYTNTAIQEDKYSLSAVESFLSSRLKDTNNLSGMEKATIDSIMTTYSSAKKIFDMYQGRKAVDSATVLQDLAKYLGVEFKDDVLLGMLNSIQSGDAMGIDLYLNGQRTTGNNQNQTTNTETKLLSSGSVLGSLVDSSDKNAVSGKVITKVQTYLSKNMVELDSASSSKKKQANELKDKYKSAKRLYNITDKKMALTSESQLQHIAELMGATKSNGSIDDALLYKKLVASGFKTGGIAKVVKRTGEDGIGLFRNGEGFVMPEHVPQIQELLKNIPQANMIMEDLNRKFALPVSGGKSNIGSTNIGDISVHLDGSNVIDAQTFMDALDNAKVRNKVVKMVGNQIAKPYMNSLSRF